MRDRKFAGVGRLLVASLAAGAIGLWVGTYKLSRVPGAGLFTGCGAVAGFPAGTCPENGLLVPFAAGSAPDTRDMMICFDARWMRQESDTEATAPVWTVTTSCTQLNLRDAGEAGIEEGRAARWMREAARRDASGRSL